ncbi:site-specific integrase [Brachybacterium tyrofermentans]|uniref:site-specific integrase n=1 Tax=Brachybacterium tyrofermentans TaxID=47848 RepID=UPI003FD3859C
MARRALARGEFGDVKLSGLVDGGWVKEDTIRTEKLKPSKWRATVLYQDGKAKRPRPMAVEDTSKERARTRLTARMAEAKTATDTGTVRGSSTVEGAVQEYVKRIDAGLLRNTRTGVLVSPSTSRTYRQVANAYVLREESSIRGMLIADVTAADLDEEAEALVAAGLGSHLNHCKVVWSAVFAAAVKARQIPVNPVASMSKIATPKADQRKHGNGAEHDKDRVLSPEESDVIYRKIYEDDDAVRKGIADLILLGMSQGLRIAEAVSIRWEDLDLDADVPTLTVAGTLQHVRGKGIVWHGAPKSAASRRTIPLLGSDVLDMLKRRRDERALSAHHHDAEVQKVRETHVFLSPKGRTPNVDNINKDVRTALDGAGFPWATFHTFRHTLSVRMKSAGVPPIVAGRFLGHTEAVSMGIYTDRGSVPVAVLGVADRLSLPASASA